MNKKISVIVCVKNEEKRIFECLKLITDNNPDEIIVVDGDSSDETATIVKKFKNVKVITSKNSNLTKDRQIGINLSKNDYILMIDADHRVYKGAFSDLFFDLKFYDLDICQSCLLSYTTNGFWDKAEQQAWEVSHNKPGRKRMIGTAPAIYKKKLFDRIQFDDKITGAIDDTDFFYRLSKFSEIRVGIGNTKIKQMHNYDFRSLYKKFYWYGKGDFEFCKKHPARASSIYYHLLIRYLFFYPFIAVLSLKFYAVPFFVSQGLIRFYSLIMNKFYGAKNEY
jgi:glycosyltransferase involved in cell wall biosynthesis